jgi:hypothetical protein
MEAKPNRSWERGRLDRLAHGIDTTHRLASIG